MNPNETITVTLSATEWNTVLTLLSEGPYKLAAPLITSVQQQCMAYEQSKQNGATRGMSREELRQDFGLSRGGVRHSGVPAETDV